MPNKVDVKEESKIPALKESKRNDVRRSAVPRMLSKFKKTKKLLSFQLKRNGEKHRNEEMYTINGTHRIKCPPSPGTSIKMDLLKKDVINSNMFYNKSKESRKPLNKALLRFFPQLFEK